MPVFWGKTAGLASTATLTSSGRPLEEPPARVDRSDPAAQGQSMTDGVRHEFLATPHRLEERLASREVGGDGGRQHAPRAVRVRGAEARTCEPLGPITVREEVIGR